ncbi:hypothetical protein QTP86_014407, partial [Hemibagrus guttatus]
KPKPKLTSNLKGDVLTGNSVTLSCTLKPQSAGWEFYWSRYTWSHSTETESDSYTISSVRVSDRGQYRCRARRGNPVYYTDYSNVLSLTVIESPKPMVIVKPDKQVFSGETVTFRCGIQSTKDIEWTYIWNKKDYIKTQEFSIRSVTVSDSDTYTCRGKISDSQFSKDSDPVTLIVSENPKLDLTSDLKGAAVTGTSVTLSCILKLHSAGWKFYWIKPTQSSESETETHHYFISSVRVSDGGQYKCRAGRGNPVYYTDYSDALWVNVTDGDVILDSPVHPVTEGHPLILRCLSRSKKIPDSGVDFYKDDSILQNQTTGEMTISSVSKSDEGFYHCKHPERGDSPKSWVSVRVLSYGKAATSVLKLLSSVVTASVYVLVTIILAVKCYRARAEPDEDNRPYRVIEAETSF